MRGIEIFYPRLRVQPVNPRARKVKPYFPGYVFGQLDLEQVGRSVVDWIPGALGLVNFGGEPAIVPEHVVNTIRQHVDAINAANNPDSLRYRPGDTVAIHAGPFSGYEAIFDVHLPGRDRAEVLLKMLQGYHLRVELPLNFISLKTASSSIHTPL